MLSNFGDFFTVLKSVNLSVSWDTLGKGDSRHSSESANIQDVFGAFDLGLHLEELALKGADHAWLELVLLSGELGDSFEVIGTNGGLLSGVVFGSVNEELVIVEFWWLSCVGSNREFNVLLPILVSLGLLSLDPLNVGSHWLRTLLSSSLLRGWGLTDGNEGISGDS